MDRMTATSALADPAERLCEGSPAHMHARAQAQAALHLMEASPTPRERLGRIVRTIEHDIIPRLVQAHREPQALPVPPTPPKVLPGDLQRFLQLVLAVEDEPWQTLLDHLQGRGIGIDEIYTELLTPAARELGRLWDEDRCDFNDVTVALGRLQRIMRLLSPAFGREVQHPPDGRRALLLPAPGEQHTLGISIVAEFFRRSGWEVVGETDDRCADPAALVRREWFDIVGLSVGIESRLDRLKSGIVAVRQASCNRAIGVMVGGPAFMAHPERAREVGADATVLDGRQAPAAAEQLLEQRLRRL